MDCSVTQRGEAIFPERILYRVGNPIPASSATTSSVSRFRSASRSIRSPSLVRSYTRGLPPACRVASAIFSGLRLLPCKIVATAAPGPVESSRVQRSTPQRTRTSNLRFRRPTLSIGDCPLFVGGVSGLTESSGHHPARKQAFFVCLVGGEGEGWKMRWLTTLIHRKTLLDWLDEYRTARGLRQNTYRTMLYAVNKLQEFAGRELAVTDLTEKLVSDWLAAYSTMVAPATVRCKRTAILVLWRAAADAGLCRAPTRNVLPVRLGWQQIVAWRPDEVQKILEVCKTLKRPHQCGLSRAVWWELAVRVAWDTALRRGDQLALTVDRIAPDGTLAVEQSKTRRIVTCRLSAPTLAMLEQSLQSCPRRLVTPWTASRESFQEQFRRIVRLSGVRQGTWKWLRRGSATDVERLHPGCGSTHLGHAPGSRIAERNYFDHSLLGRDAAQPTLLR